MYDKVEGREAFFQGRESNWDKFTRSCPCLFVFWAVGASEDVILPSEYVKKDAKGF